jgi:uncharacterized protein YbjT (DUF2867 family)
MRGKMRLLTDNRAGQRNKLFKVTGPRALSFAECIQEIASSTGRPLKYTQVPVDAYVDALQQQGMPEDMQWLLRELFTVVFDGRNSKVMPGVEQALGRPATDFSSYVQKTIATGVRDPSMQSRTA